MTSPLDAFHPRNLLTCAALFAGFVATAAALQHQPGLAGGAIALAVIADTFDGRFARRIDRSPDRQALGVCLDSLSDACTFAAAPAICSVALAAGRQPTALVIGIGFAFVACGVARLAFYTVTHATTDGFIGLPAPVAALLWSSVLLLGDRPGAQSACLALAAAAMVAPVRVPRPAGAGLVLFALWPAAVLVAHVAAR